MGKDIWVGGIAGNIGGEAVMQRCYNIGEVNLELTGTQGTYQRLAAGGCLGRNEAKISDCYNIGKVSTTAGYDVNRGAVFGRLSESGGITENVYYKSGAGITGFGNMADLTGMAKTETEMKSKEFLQLLNKNTPNAYKEDVNNINNGYPILSWQ